MPPSVTANEQKETEDAWVRARVQESSAAASDGCGPSWWPPRWLAPV